MDEEFLYLAAKIHDNDIARDTQLALWKQDYLGVVINGDPLPRSIMNTGSGWYNQSFIIALNPETTDFATESIYEERYPEALNYTWATQTEGDTYTFELALPIPYLKDLQGENWRHARINLWVLDVDAEEEDEFHFWQPNWRGPGHRVGSGMFFRQ